jgi:hypothetical protein
VLDDAISLKVEIRLNDPSDDIKKAMREQKTAEQERRSMKLLGSLPVDVSGLPGNTNSKKKSKST